MSSTGISIAAGAVAAAAWVVIGTMQGDYLGRSSGISLGVLAPYLVMAGLASAMGWRRDRTGAILVAVGGIIGAGALAWSFGPVGVTAGASEELRSSYHLTLILIGAGIVAVLGTPTVWVAYRLGLLARRRLG